LEQWLMSLEPLIMTVLKLQIGRLVPGLRLIAIIGSLNTVLKQLELVLNLL